MADPQFSDDEIQQKIRVIRQARGGIAGNPSTDLQEAIRQLQQEHDQQEAIRQLQQEHDQQEAIRQLQQEHDQQEAIRQLQQEHDQQEAIQQLEQERMTKQRRSLLYWLNQQLMWVEKRAIEPMADWLDRADIFRIIEKLSPLLEAIGVIAIPVAIWHFTQTSQDAKDRQDKAVRAQTEVQNYLNQLSSTLTTGKLREDKDLQTIVRASTLALLDNPDLQADPDLDKDTNWRNDRKGQVIGYLSETGLIQVRKLEQSQNKRNGEQKSNQKSPPVISLINANLRGANLSHADLSRAYLSKTDLSGAYLSGAYLFYADLSGADLSGTKLSYAVLSDAYLSDADLRSANLDGANFSDAYLSDADLSDADLSGATLNGAYLSKTDLSGADFSYADLRNVGNWTEQQLSQAKLCKTELPSGSHLNPDRDCKALGIPTP